MNENRQTGRTTEQIKNAPLNAIYVWPFGSSLNYAKRLAREHSREDLEIIPECFFRQDKIMSRRGIAVVIDHATELSREGMDAFRYAQHRLKPES